MRIDANSVVIRNVSPEIDGGRFAIKRVPGEQISVAAEVFSDGQDALSVVLKYRPGDRHDWTEVPMTESEADCWSASFTVTAIGCYVYTVEAWKNPVRTWWRCLKKKIQVGAGLSQDLASVGTQLELAAASASCADLEALKRFTYLLQSANGLVEVVQNPGLESEFDQLLSRNGPRLGATRYITNLRVVVDPQLARSGAWYQLFPRSCAGEPLHHGSLRDVARRLPGIAKMGFDVVCLTPLHPIGLTARKGRNNSLTAQPGDPGSPWAVGSKDGGHKAVHPELGTLNDLHFLLSQARELGMEIALDIALQCSPDHPYVDEHPNWFRRGADGSIQFGEDPPNRYEDIYPFDFASEDSRLWEELKSIFVFWIEQGVRVFRVDNPHTKPFAFWAWLISDLKNRWPELILLAEGLTRPRPMVHLARVGFSLSYDYFPWRNSKAEVTEYYSRLACTELKEYFRPCLWPNTPQHLPVTLQHEGRAAFMIRLLLAATLGASYGIYGPAFELCENRPMGPGSVDYLNSEQYELKMWDWDRPGDLRELIALVNGIRRSNVALQSNEQLHFHSTDNDQILAFTKADATRTEIVLTVVNLDPDHIQSGWLALALDALGMDQARPFIAHDLLTGTVYPWQGKRTYVSLDPSVLPAHVLRLERPRD